MHYEEDYNFNPSYPLQLNFATFRRQLKGLKKTTANTQVIGFTDDDSHSDVMLKAAKGLGIECDIDLLQLVCSNGLVPDNPIEGQHWTLGKYIEHHGGTRNRGEKVWGLHVPFDESGPFTRDSVRKALLQSLCTICVLCRDMLTQRGTGSHLACLLQIPVKFNIEHLCSMTALFYYRKTSISTTC